MPEAVRYPAELQVADEGTFDGFHDPFRIPYPVLGKYLDEVLVKGGKNAVSEEVETLFQPFVELAEQKAGEDGIAAAVGDDVPDEAFHFFDAGGLLWGLERALYAGEHHDQGLPVQGLLVRKVVIERSRRQFHLGCDIAYRDGVVAFGRKEPGSGLHDGDFSGRAGHGYPWGWAGKRRPLPYCGKGCGLRQDGKAGRRSGLPGTTDEKTGKDQPSRISMAPPITMRMAMMRERESRSCRKMTASSMPKITEVSRRAATRAIGARVMAQRAMP